MDRIELVRRAKEKRSFFFELAGYVVETALIGGLLTMVADLPTSVAVPLAVIFGVFGLVVVRYVEYQYHLQHTIPLEIQQERIAELEPDRVEAEAIETKWLPEAEEFGRRAGKFWDAIREQFHQYGTLGHPTTPSGLDERVWAASWPNEMADTDEDWPEGEELSPHTSAFFLRDFVKRLYEHDTSSFEPHRKELAILTKRWQSRAENAADDVFESWLGPAAGAANISTVKLLWYVEIAKAESMPNPAPEYAPYVFLRDVLMRSMPDTETRDEPAQRIGIRITKGSKGKITKPKIRSQDISIDVSESEAVIEEPDIE